jgi:putative transposase
LPLVVAVTGGQAHDSPALAKLLAELRVARTGGGRPRTTPTVLHGDKAYGGRANRDLLHARGITVVIPEKENAIAGRKAKGSRGGRPLSFDAEDYKNRNVVERTFNRLKNWRGIATRYDKHAVTYRGSVVLGSIVMWLA